MYQIYMPPRINIKPQENYIRTKKTFEFNSFIAGRIMFTFCFVRGVNFHGSLSFLLNISLYYLWLWNFYNTRYLYRTLNYTKTSYEMNKK